jgi:hypothetical protein
MKKPEALLVLLEELQNEAVASDIVPLATSKVVIYTDPEATDEEDGIVLTGDQSKLVFASVDTVERLLDALDEPDEASICFFDLSLPAAVMDVVERRFVAVDEG